MKKYSDEWLNKHGWYNIVDYWFWMELLPRLVFSKKPFWEVRKHINTKENKMKKKELLESLRFFYGFYEHFNSVKDKDTQERHKQAYQQIKKMIGETKE